MQTAADVSSNDNAARRIAQKTAERVTAETGNAFIKFVELQLAPLKQQINDLTNRLTALETKRSFWPTRATKGYGNGR